MATKKRKKPPLLYWHSHHDQLIESFHRASYPTTPAKRLVQIKRKNPDFISLRLHLFKRVKGKLPKRIVEGLANYGGFKRLMPDDQALVRGLHAQECCPCCPMHDPNKLEICPS